MTRSERDAVASASDHLRSIGLELADPDDDLDASAATRHRLEDAALALEAISRLPERSAPGSSDS